MDDVRASYHHAPSPRQFGTSISGSRWHLHHLKLYYIKRANATATTMAANELLPTPMAWPMLKGISVGLGVGATMVPFVPLDGSGYLPSRVNEDLADD